MPTILWRLQLADGTHVINATTGLCGGARIEVDGRLVNPYSSGNYHQFYVAGHFCELDIRSRRVPTQYNLYVEGKHVETGLSREEMTKSMREFGYVLFVLLFGIVLLVPYLLYYCTVKKNRIVNIEVRGDAPYRSNRHVGDGSDVKSPLVARMNI